VWKTEIDGGDPMSNMGDCKSMELKCRQRANADPDNRQKWLAQADRWRDLGRAEKSWRLQKTTQQVMHAGPMAMQPSASTRPPKQQG
jgi:hypothetical protein